MIKATRTSLDSSYIPVDFHFGGQHTSLTEDEAGGFGLWTRRLGLHGSTQPASCYLPPSCYTTPSQPAPLLSLSLSQPALPLLYKPSPSLLCLCLGLPLASSLSNGNLWFLSLCTKQFSSSSKQLPPPPTSTRQSPRIRVIPSLFICAMSAESASERQSQRGIQTVIQMCSSHGSSQLNNTLTVFGPGFTPR